jgi:methionyl-tRNA synthetase
MWPAMLMAADLPVPSKVWCHGWVKTGGERFSKTAGVAITLRETIDYHGVDALRYFLLREVPWDSDGNFTFERFDVRYTAELADALGNLVSRVTSMIVRYLDGAIPSADQSELDTLASEVRDAYQAAMDRHLLHRGAQEAWKLVDRANAFVEQRAPWTLAKEGKTQELGNTLGSLARTLARIAILLGPFMPGKSDEIWAALGLDGSATGASWEAYADPGVDGLMVQKPAPLFPKPSAG